jgi:hypothetical protein
MSTLQIIFLMHRKEDPQFTLAKATVSIGMIETAVKMGIITTSFNTANISLKINSKQPPNTNKEQCPD